jgi:integrase
VIGVAWDTQMSPGDVRKLRASQMATVGQGMLCFTERGKTGKPVGGVLSARTLRLLQAYLEDLGVTLHGEAYIFRNRSGAPYSKDTLGDDFRDIRAAEFGPRERRMLGHDFRRSGAVEAITGDATPAALSHTMGNTLSASNSLFATYVPVCTATIQSVFAARKKGRGMMR